MKTRMRPSDFAAGLSRRIWFIAPANAYTILFIKPPAPILARRIRRQRAIDIVRGVSGYLVKPRFSIRWPWSITRVLLRMSFSLMTSGSAPIAALRNLWCRQEGPTMRHAGIENSTTRRAWAGSTVRGPRCSSETTPLPFSTFPMSGWWVGRLDGDFVASRIRKRRFLWRQPPFDRPVPRG